MSKIKSDMQTIKLRELIESKGLKFEYVGKRLFPKARFPYMAIKRVMDGKAVLDANQISLLSQITETPISGLFAGGEWVANMTSETITFTSGEYTAELYPKSWHTKIYKNKDMFHEVILAHAGITLSEYLKLINEIIIKSK